MIAQRGVRAGPTPHACEIFLQLELAGGTHFIGRLDRHGCTSVFEVPDGALVLVSDGRDARLARTTPIGRREAASMVAEINPDIEYRLLYRPGAANIVYARPRDDLPEAGEFCPLLLALELLGRPAPRSVTVLAIGPEARPELLLIVAHDADGQIDPGSLQVWLQPQDTTASLATDYAERGHHRIDSDLRIHTQFDLLQLARDLPRYARARPWFGRTIEQWAAAALPALAACTALGCAAAMWQAYGLLQMQRVRGEHKLAIASLDAQLASLAADSDPARLATAASVDYPKLIAAARELWLTGATVRIDASTAATRLTLVLRPGGQDGARPETAATIDSRNLAAVVESVLARPAPAGFERGEIFLNGDTDGVAIVYRAQNRRAAAAELLGD